MDKIVPLGVLGKIGPGKVDHIGVDNWRTDQTFAKCFYFSNGSYPALFWVR